MTVTFNDRIEELRADREHGSSWLARRAVETLMEVADEPAKDWQELLQNLVSAGRELSQSRPGVGAVSGAVGRVLGAVRRQSTLDLEQLRRLIKEEAQGLIDARTRAAASIAIQLRPRLTDSVILTHSASATVREALLYTPPERVICTVSYPAEEGRAFAEELRAEGLKVDLVEDDQAPGELSWASLLLVGADTVFRDGALCNKIGTSHLAQAAAEEGVPTVVACEVIKLAPIDAADSSDLTPDARLLFDLTPPELIEEVVTEEGTYPIEELRVLIDRTPFLREGYALLHPTAAGA